MADQSLPYVVPPLEGAVPNLFDTYYREQAEREAAHIRATTAIAPWQPAPVPWAPTPVGAHYSPDAGWTVGGTAAAILAGGGAVALIIYAWNVSTAHADRIRSGKGDA